jgi:hypothetical protein
LGGGYHGRRQAAHFNFSVREVGARVAFFVGFCLFFSGDNLQAVDFMWLLSVDKVDNIVSPLSSAGYLKILGLRVPI